MTASGSSNPNDAIRGNMLRYFYDRAQNARSKTGKFGYAAKISDVKADLKERHGYKQPQVEANLRYLIDREWVKEEQVKKEIKTKSGMVVSPGTSYYAISAEGTDKIEGGSEFETPPRYAGINIQATGGNVINLGDGNYVNVAHQQLHTQLSELRNQIVESELSEPEKYATAVDIGTLQDQLAKVEPDKPIVNRLWGQIDKAAKLAGLATFAAEIAKGISGLAG